MQQKRYAESDRWEQLLSQALGEFATDLRLLEAVDFLSLAGGRRSHHVTGLVQSSAELYFRPGALLFAGSGDVRLNWRRPPQVALDMEFHWGDVHVFFRLQLEARFATVEIHYVHFDAADGERRGCELLADALAAARSTSPRVGSGGLI